MEKKYRYKSLGLPLNDTVNPVRVFTSPMVSPVAERVRSVESMDDEGASNGTAEQWERVNKLFQECDSLQREIQSRVDTLGVIHTEMESLMKGKEAPQRTTHLPTPEDIVSDETTADISRYSQIPSSPESYSYAHSHSSQLEPQLQTQTQSLGSRSQSQSINAKHMNGLGDRITRMEHSSYPTQDGTKLKSIYDELMLVLDHVSENVDEDVKLENAEMLRMRGEKMVSEFEELVGCYE